MWIELNWIEFEFELNWIELNVPWSGPLIQRQFWFKGSLAQCHFGSTGLTQHGRTWLPDPLHPPHGWRCFSPSQKAIKKARQPWLTTTVDGWLAFFIAFLKKAGKASTRVVNHGCRAFFISFLKKAKKPSTDNLGWRLSRLLYLFFEEGAVDGRRWSVDGSLLLLWRRSRKAKKASTGRRLTPTPSSVDGSPS